MGLAGAGALDQAGAGAATPIKAVSEEACGPSIDEFASCRSSLFSTLIQSKL